MRLRVLGFNAPLLHRVGEGVGDLSDPAMFCLIWAFALRSVLPLTLGATQRGGWRLNVAWTDGLPGVSKK
jgi:hypothetical protein